MCFKHCVKHKPLDLEKHLKNIEWVVFLNRPGQSSNTVSQVDALVERCHSLMQPPVCLLITGRWS